MGNEAYMNGEFYGDNSISLDTHNSRQSQAGASGANEAYTAPGVPAAKESGFEDFSETDSLDRFKEYRPSRYWIDEDFHQPDPYSENDSENAGNVYAEAEAEEEPQDPPTNSEPHMTSTIKPDATQLSLFQDLINARTRAAAEEEVERNPFSQYESRSYQEPEPETIETVSFTESTWESSEEQFAPLEAEPNTVLEDSLETVETAETIEPVETVETEQEHQVHRAWSRFEDTFAPAAPAAATESEVSASDTTYSGEEADMYSNDNEVIDFSPGEKPIDITQREQQGEEFSSSALYGQFLRLFENRFASSIKRMNSNDWRETSRYHYLADHDILSAITGTSDVYRACLPDNETHFAVILLEEGSYYQSAEGLEKLRDCLSCIGIVNTKLYKAGDSDQLQLYAFLDRPIESSVISKLISGWLRRNGIIPGTVGLNLFPGNKPLPLPLQPGFAWLNDRGQVIANRDEITPDAALALFFADIQRCATNAAELVERLEKVVGDKA